MPFATQVSLSLELARAVSPLSSTATGKTLDLAQSVQESGLDIFMEEDLAAIFHNNRIDPALEIGFKKEISRSRIMKLSECLYVCLRSGLGPTVSPTLNSPAYLRMVIQLFHAMLVAVSSFACRKVLRSYPTPRRGASAEQNLTFSVDS